MATELRYLWHRHTFEVGSASFSGTLALIVFPWVGLWMASLIAERTPEFAFGGGYLWIVAGLLLVVCGLLLRYSAERARRRLGRRRHLVAELPGPYRYIRHPSFTASLVTMLGFGLALANFASLAVCILVPLIGYLHQISLEEPALASLLGDDYSRYERSTARLVPGVW